MIYIKYNDRVARRPLELAEFTIGVRDRALEVMNEERVKGHNKEICDVLIQIKAKEDVPSTRRAVALPPPSSPAARPIGTGVNGRITRSDQLQVQREALTDALTGVELYHQQLVEKWQCH